MRSPYEDIIHLPRHVSAVHPQMGRQERAAQFAPFAALTGHDAALRETRRLTDREMELSEDEKRVLDETQQQILELLPLRPTVSVTYFVPDERKSGGAYETVEKPVRRIDAVARTMHMTDGQIICLQNVVALELIRE